MAAILHRFQSSKKVAHLQNSQHIKSGIYGLEFSDRSWIWQPAQ